jgi:hypothetical protein
MGRGLPFFVLFSASAIKKHPGLTSGHLCTHRIDAKTFFHSDSNRRHRTLTGSCAHSGARGLTHIGMTTDRELDHRSAPCPEGYWLLMLKVYPHCGSVSMKGWRQR